MSIDQCSKNYFISVYKVTCVIGSSLRITEWSTHVVEGIMLEKFCVTMCNVAISMRKFPGRNWRSVRVSCEAIPNSPIVAPSPSVRSTDVFPASLQKVLSCQLVRVRLKFAWGAFYSFSENDLFVIIYFQFLQKQIQINIGVDLKLTYLVVIWNIQLF